MKKIPKKTALITGAAGFIGSHLADSLIDQGYTIFGIDNFLTGDKANVNPAVIFEEMDLRNQDALDKYLEKIKPRYVFHLAAVARTLWTVENPHLCHDINITGSLNVLTASQKAKVKKVIYASSNIVYAEFTPYKVSKMTGELYMRTFDKLYKLPTISLRFANVYGSLRQSEKGPSINCIASLRQSKRENGYVWITGDGTQSRDFIHVLDLVQGLKLAAESKIHDQEIDLCTGINTTLNQIAQYFNCPIKHVADRKGDIKHIYQDPKPAKKLLGFEAKRRIEDHIQIYL